MTQNTDTPPSIGDWNFNERTKMFPNFGARLLQARQDGTALAAAHLVSDTVGGNGQAFNLADVLPANAFITSTGPRPDGIDAVVANAQTQISAMEQASTATIQQAQQQCGNDQAAFIAQMEAAKTQAKQQMDATIDAAYANLNTIGQQHPEAQPLIIQAMGELSALVTSAQSVVSSTFDTAISAAELALAAIELAAEAAAKAIASAATTVGDGIASIFSGW